MIHKLISFSSYLYHMGIIYPKKSLILLTQTKCLCNHNCAAIRNSIHPIIHTTN